MPSFPPPGGVTVCEINRDLVVADALSDDRAKDAYGDVLGMVFSPIPFQPDATVATHEPPAVTEAAEPAEVVPRTSLASTIAESFKQMLFPSCNVSLVLHHILVNQLLAFMILLLFCHILPHSRCSPKIYTQAYFCVQSAQDRFFLTTVL
jgi:hypothetical protein